MKWKITLYARGYEGKYDKNKHLFIHLECDKEEAISVARAFSAAMKRTWSGSRFVVVKSEDSLETFHIR